ncbi:uncharacterized protein LOC118500166 [Phyllostomus discolor]|uniref:Uncharacterized protein LOC118500166 n=1 Tax=Phyllostomus discolor TaxID=89673 RepID=A0A7E6DL55_9CHIR|nr:uncharacterized protein LOC118500166 [Phyllostomus discolor]
MRVLSQIMGCGGGSERKRRPARGQRGVCQGELAATASRVLSWSLSILPACLPTVSLLVPTANTVPQDEAPGGSFGGQENRGLSRACGRALGVVGVSGPTCHSHPAMLWDQGHFPEALEVKQRATGPLEVSPEVFTREEKEECLLDGDLGLASLNMEATPWSHLLTLYKQLQKLAMAKEEGEEEEMEEEDSSFQLCVPGIVTLQSPLHKTFRSTDTVGCMESELEKLLVVQQESRLWKMGGHEGQEPLVHPEISLEEAGIVDDQGHQADGEGSHHPAFGECWGLPGREALRQLKHHPRLERGVQSPPSVVYSTEHLLLRRWMRRETGLQSEAGAGQSRPAPDPWNLRRDTSPSSQEHPRSSQDQGVLG